MVFTNQSWWWDDINVAPNPSISGLTPSYRILDLSNLRGHQFHRTLTLGGVSLEILIVGQQKHNKQQTIKLSLQLSDWFQFNCANKKKNNHNKERRTDGRTYSCCWNVTIKPPPPPSRFLNKTIVTQSCGTMCPGWRHQQDWTCWSQIT